FFSLCLGVAVGVAVVLFLFGIRAPWALVALACSFAALLGVGLYFASNRKLLSVPATLAANGVHIGLLMMIIGVAASGPYQQKYTLELNRGGEGVAGDYHITLNELYEGQSEPGPDGKPNYIFIEAELMVRNKAGGLIGKLSPQRRLYANFESQSYAEVDTLFSLNNEIYATLAGLDANNRATVAVNVNPLVNWLWIGGALMSLFPFGGLARIRREEKDEGTGD
ncbi:MAG: heme lyase CcmF/NrfE family subunit, partial [Desulfovibrio sp.]|nr:heme lyase CcmF/NrfE family subunit [Desulfovibrio sp.]